MATLKMKQEFRKMVMWAIRKMFENNPTETININDLKKQLEIAWDDLVDAGEIEITNEPINEKRPNKR